MNVDELTNIKMGFYGYVVRKLLILYFLWNFIDLKIRSFARSFVPVRSYDERERVRWNGIHNVSTTYHIKRRACSIAVQTAI